MIGMPVSRDHCHAWIVAFSCFLTCAVESNSCVALAASENVDPPIISCPDKIFPPRAGAIAPSGWRIYWDDTLISFLNGAEVLTGHGSNLTEIRSTIRYENIDAKQFKKRKTKQSWSLPRASPSQPFLILCRYEWSSVILSREIPATARSCRMTAQYYGNPHPGYPVTVECR